MKDDAQTVRTAGLLTLFSVFCLIEGGIRLTRVVGSSDWDGDDNVFPPIVLLLASLTEVIFALSGLLPGLLALVTEQYHKFMALPALVLINAGWFTFVVYVFALPAFNAARNPGHPGLTDSEDAGATVFGIFGSMAICASMQGGQFVFALRLHRHLTDDMDKYTKLYIKVRNIVYTSLYVLFGVSMLSIGALAQAQLGGGRVLPPLVKPPFFVVYPELTITAGVITTLVSAVALFRAITGMTKLAPVYYALIAFDYLCNLGFLVYPQIGLIPAGPVFAVGMLTCLFAAVRVMPVFFERQAIRASKKD